MRANSRARLEVEARVCRSLMRPRESRAGAAQSGHRGELGGAAGGDVARDEDGDDGEDRGPEIMAPVPGHQKMVRVENAADLNGNLRHAPGHERAGEAADD